MAAMTMASAEAGPSSRATALLHTFEGFRQEIDAANDRRDRLLKASRDITTASKRLIFHLHRFPHAAFGKDNSKPGTGAAKVLSEAVQKRDEIVALLVQVAQAEGLTEREGGAAGIDWEPGRAIRYDRAYGGALEEFIEAISFLHFLQHGTILTLDQVQALFQRSDGLVLLPITPQRYALGLSDLSGELMRFATNALGTGQDGQAVVASVLAVMRSLSAALEPFVPLVRDFRKKQQVTMQSTRKIEDLSYAVKVRTAEFGQDQEAIREMVRRALTTDGGGRGRGEEDEGMEEG